MLQKSASLTSIAVSRIALLDAYGKIVAVNQQWLDLAAQTKTSTTRVGPGVNYLEICSQAADSTDAKAALRGIRAVLQNQLESFSMDYCAHLASGKAHFRMTAMPFAYGEARVIVVHVDVTDLQLSNDQHYQRVQQFAHHLMRSQEEERQRISREIHDDLSNRIALLASLVRGMKVRSGKRSGSRDDDLGEIMNSITGLSNALRDLSRGLHPPVLKYAGICAALTSLCEEFGRMHGVEVDVIVPTERPQLPAEVELCIFRISQECLTNIAKHSGAKNVALALEATPSEVQLKVTDTGCGFLKAEAMQKRGLGLISMEERVLSLGGNLEVQSTAGEGTEVRVTIPRRNVP